MLRKQRQLTQERLAELADLSPAYVARIESGAREATLRTLHAIATALDAPLARLFEDESAGVPAALRIAAAGLAPSDLALLGAIAARFRSPVRTTRH